MALGGHPTAGSLHSRRQPSDASFYIDSGHLTSEPAAAGLACAAAASFDIA